MHLALGSQPALRHRFLFLRVQSGTSINFDYSFIYCPKKHTISEFKWTAKSIAEINWNAAVLNVTKLMDLNATVDFFAARTDRWISGIVVIVITKAFIAW